MSELLKKAGLSQHLQAFQGISMENFKALLMQASCSLPSLAGMNKQLLDRQHAIGAMPAIVIALHLLPSHNSTLFCCAC